MKPTTPRRLGWCLVLAGLAVAAAGMGLAVLTAPHWYVAPARVKVEAWLNGDTSAYYDPFFIQKEFELIQSPAVLSNAIARVDFNTPAGRKLNFLRALPSADACAFLQSSFNLRPVRSTTLAEIRASHDDPDAAAAIANAIAAAYCGLPAERRGHYTPAESAWLAANLRRDYVGPEWQAGLKATLLAAREDRLLVRVKVEMIDPATPPNFQVTLEQRFTQWLHPGSCWLPGPPAHPHGRLSLGLIALGVVLGVSGLDCFKRPTI